MALGKAEWKSFALPPTMSPLRKGQCSRPIASFKAWASWLSPQPRVAQLLLGWGAQTRHPSRTIRKAGPSWILYACGSQRQVSMSALILPSDTDPPHIALSPVRKRDPEALRRKRRDCEYPCTYPELSQPGRRRGGTRNYFLCGLSCSFRNSTCLLSSGRKQGWAGAKEMSG